MNTQVRYIKARVIRHRYAHKLVLAEVYGRWGMHLAVARPERYEHNGFEVTHIGTGLAVRMQYPERPVWTRRQAEKLIRALANAKIDGFKVRAGDEVERARATKVIFNTVGQRYFVIE